MKSLSERIRQRYIVFLLVVSAIFVMLFSESIFQRNTNKRNSFRNTKGMVDQFENVIEENEKNKDIFMQELKENYIVRAGDVAYLLEKNRALKNDTEELLKICDLMQVDEIHLFDTEGTLYAGTVPEYYGYNFDSGDQLGFFKPMLTDTSLTLCQDITPNTAEGKYMMYAMVWMADGSSLVQIGVESGRVYREQKRYDIATVASSVPVYDGIHIFIAYADSGVICGSSDIGFHAMTLEEIGARKVDYEAEKVQQFTTRINGKVSYCSFRKSGDYIIGVVQERAYANQGLFLTLAAVFVYLAIAALVLVIILNKLNKRIQAERENRIKEQQIALESLRQQLALIDGISKDYTDILLIDFSQNKSYMLKSGGKMKDLEAVTGGEGLAYDETWEIYTKKFIPEAEAAQMLVDVSAKVVLEKLEKQDEYVYTYHGIVQGEIHNYQVKFTKITDNVKDSEFVAAAIRNIDGLLDAQKKLDELEEQANKDKLTGMYNRRAYEDDIALYQEQGIAEDFVFISMDVNGLKQVNDTKGHDAGDELIKGAASCISKTFAKHGKLYRTGGDELVAMIHVSKDKLDELMVKFKGQTEKWHGRKVEELAISIGCVERRDFPKKTMKQIIKIADQRMYEAKAAFYAGRGRNVDRRNMQAAYDVICNFYTKVLRVNLTEDSFSVIRMEDSENTTEKGYDERISKWLYNFAVSGQVYAEDAEEYKRRTSLEYLREYFEKEDEVYRIFYRRYIGGGLHKVMMEIVPAKEYAVTNQIVYLYVKELD